MDACSAHRELLALRCMSIPPMLVTWLRALASRVSDTGVRVAIEVGITAATQALQKRGGQHVSIRHAEYTRTYDPGSPGGNAGTPGGVAGGYSPGRDF